MRAATLVTTSSSASFEFASRTTCADRSCCVFFTGFISLLLAFGPIWILRPPPSELSRSWVLFRNSQRPGFLRLIHDGKHLFALEDLFLQESLRQAVQGIAVLGQDASRLLMGLCYQPLDLDIQALCRHLRVHALAVF